MRFLILTLLFCLGVSLVGAQVTFQKTYGGSAMETCHDAKQTKDGGFIMVGETNSFGDGASDVYLVKTDSLGDIAWAKTYGGHSDDGGYFVEQTSDSGYVVIGYTFSFGIGGEDVYIVRTDKMGDTLWTEAFGGSYYDWGTCIRQTADGGFIFTGTTYPNSLLSTIYLVRLSAVGTPVWVQTYGGDSLFCFGSSLEITSDGGFLLAGSSTCFGPHPYTSDMYLIKTNTLGVLQWSRTFGGANQDYGYDAKQTSDGGYIMVGTTHSFGYGNGDIYMVKTNSSGNYVWSRTYGGPNLDDGVSVMEAVGGGYFIAGTTENYSGGIDYVCLMKTDNVGNPLWAETFGGSSCSNTGVSVHQTKDGGCIIGGTTCSFPSPGGGDLYLMKTEYFDNTLCSNGPVNLLSTYSATTATQPVSIRGPQVGAGGYKTATATHTNTGGTMDVHCFALGVAEISNETNITATVYPSPCNDYARIMINGVKVNPSEIKLLFMDVLGRVVEINYSVNNEKNGFTLDLRNVPSGIYFCRIEGGINYSSGLKILVNK